MEALPAVPHEPLDFGSNGERGSGHALEGKFWAIPVRGSPAADES